jgi:hypothetical protein
VHFNREEWAADDSGFDSKKASDPVWGDIKQIEIKGY